MPLQAKYTTRFMQSRRLLIDLLTAEILITGLMQIGHSKLYNDVVFMIHKYLDDVRSWEALQIKILKALNLEYYSRILKLEYKEDDNGNSIFIDSQNIWNKVRSSYKSDSTFQVFIEDIPHIERIDNALSRYYKYLNVSYDHIFKHYCEDYGITEELDDGEIEPDNGHIIFELSASPYDSLVVEFDDDFPFPDDKERDEKQRYEFILNLLKQCYLNPAVQFRKN